MFKFVKRQSIYTSIFCRLIFLLFLYQITRWLFYIENKNYFFDVDYQRYLTIMTGGMRFDLCAILYVNLLWIFLFLLPLKFKYSKFIQNLSTGIYILFNTIAIFFDFIDIIYFPFSNRRLTLDVFSEFKNETNLLGIFWEAIHTYWYLSLIFVVMVIVLILFSRWTSVRLSEKQNIFLIRFFILHSIGFIIFSTLIVFGLRGSFILNTRPMGVFNAGEYTSKPIQVYLVTNTPFFIIRTSQKKILQPVNFYKSKTTLDAIYTPIQKARNTLNFNPKNVVIIILESFASEYSALYNKRLKPEDSYTPFLDSLYQHSNTFLYSFANGRKSIDAMPSVLVSLPRVVTPFSLSKYIANDVNSIASILSKKGYTSVFAHGAPTGSMGFNSIATLFGFQEYYGMDEYDKNEDYDGYWGIWDHKFMLYFADILNKTKQPFVASLFSVNSHHPFVLPKEFENRYQNKGEHKNNKVIQYTDESLKNFFNKIKEEKWYQNTLFVITADHSSINQYNEFATYIGIHRVPIAFFTPDKSIKPIFDTIRNAQQIDILPTVLSHLNYQGAYTAFGYNLNTVTPDEHFTFYTNGDHYIVNYKKYTLQYDLEKDKVLGLYNFKKDKLLAKNLKNIPYFLSIKEKMLAKLKGFIQQYHSRMNTNTLIKYE